ncbi:MAG TPA: bifunctional phosphoribosyl-AMP cyclohydrolase/phosphoribosyl-ATP diphosphatase HisIE [Bacteroidia bacterium]|jgi:phosphoribosyl-ATP pyrophosphohydrolase/phosphoribosyl-AMP cyclohydrolase|nr:bifunctional phosphoribosyl-AMP cyclohydrolase/phosphoribosyl-ATP diphosphatase HisIE [Bacteroidia bacterium]
MTMTPNFKKSPDGLIPVVVQDSFTNKVLMLGYMNEQAFENTKKEKRVTFFSRSKNRLWTKGEESGHFLDVDNILIDCDEDTLLIKAKPAGPVCHTGADTCFKEANSSNDFLLKLEGIIRERKMSPSGQSYTSSLFAKGINKIAQKVGEEAVELVIEAKDDNDDLFKNEAADLLFHYLILLQAKGFELSDITKILQIRNSK